MLKFVVFSFLLALSSASTCNDETRAKRRAWHTLSTDEKQDYLDAEVCLMKLPPRLGLTGATSRFEELQVTHQLQTHAVHKVGAFLPFHRAFIYMHEEALRTECGFKGSHPYWAEELDAGSFVDSPVLDPDTGFGGNATGNNLCVTDGPFAGYINHVGPRYELTTRCLTRQVNDTDSLKASQSNIDACLTRNDYISMWQCLEMLPHQAGHGGVGGTLGLMRDPVASPGDPLFYVHHAWIDKLWADWQKKDLPKRLSEMGGVNILNETEWPTFPTRPASIPKPTGADGDPGLVTTLGHVLNLFGNGDNRTIGDVMDICNGDFCFEYMQY